MSLHNKDPLIGRMLDDYKIEDLLGHGGMARVYRALDVKLNRYAEGNDATNEQVR